MIVDHFDTGLSGGAAVAAQRLHLALRARGVESRYWCRRRCDPLPNDASYRYAPWPPSGTRRFAQLRSRVLAAMRKLRLKTLQHFYLSGRPAGREFFSSPCLPFPTPYAFSTFQGDIVHLHWIANLIDYPSFFGSLPSALPVVWTLHDMNPFTGGCHHADECGAFAAVCRNCPQLGRPGPQDLSYRNFVVKQKAFRNLDLHVVTPSRWLERWAQQSRLLAGARSFRTIHNGLDLRRFFPLAKPAARRALGLPAEGVMVAFGAAAVNNPRKGFREFLGALAGLPRSPRVCGLVLGQGSIPNAVKEIALHGLGFVTDSAQTAQAYAAADLFVLPSHAENMPQMAVEAMACGTPVVAFDVGGIPEIVRPDETGLLARPMDVVDLARQIRRLVEQPEQRLRLGFQARRLVEREFDEQRQTGEYLNLYRTVLSQHGAAGSEVRAA